MVAFEGWACIDLVMCQVHYLIFLMSFMISPSSKHSPCTCMYQSRIYDMHSSQTLTLQAWIVANIDNFLFVLLGDS